MSGPTSSTPEEIYVAAGRGELPKVVKWLRKGGHVDALHSWEDKEARTLSSGLLHAAARNGQLAVAKELLKRGATAGCGHLFHRHCVLKWLEKESKCPLCNHRVVG